MIVGNLVCTGQDTYAVEKATFPVLFSSNLSSSLLESPMQALEDLVMPHTSSDGSCTPANLAELCTAIKPDTSDMDKDCFKVTYWQTKLSFCVEFISSAGYALGP